MNFNRIKNFYASDPINRVKRQPMKWEKMVADHLSDKELIFTIYKELQLNHHHNRKKKTPKTNN